MKNIRYIAFIASLSVLFSLMFNIPYYYTILKTDVTSIALSVLAGTLQLGVFWYLLAINRTVFIILGSLTFVMAAGFSYYMAVYKIVVSVGLIRVILLADPREVSGFFEPMAIVWGVLSIAVFIAFVIWRFRLQRKISKIQIIVALVILSAVAFGSKALAPKSIKRHPSMPYVYYEHIYHYALESIRIKKFLSNKTDISKIAEFKANSPEDLVVIYIVGESVRGDHLHINGYEKQTTSNMEALDMLSFPRALSCKTLTSYSITCMFTRATLPTWESSLKETSFISIFNKVGFKTFWLSNQGRLGHDTWVGSIASESQDIYFCDDNKTFGASGLDTCMLPTLNSYVNDPAKRKYITIHMFGSHLRYDDRYTKEQELFTPVCDKSKAFSDCQGEPRVNVYDNSIVAADYFINDVVATVKDKNALIIFTSDHAEPLGENGKFSRGDDSEIYQRHVPFMVWMSDKFKKDNNKYEIIKNNLSKAVGHDNVIYSILDCVGIESDIIDRDQSVCSETLKEYEDTLIKWQ